jgi:acyl carrier protein
VAALDVDGGHDVSQVTEDRVFEILAKVTRRDKASIKPEHDLASDLNLSSAHALDLLFTLEEETGAEISEVEAAKLRTVRDVLALVKAKA